jgi:hypothetical protein
MINKLDRVINRYGKEFMCWGDETCICFHSEEAHENTKMCLGIAGPNLDIDCRCTEYHPKDNLVFLEYKAKEKNRSGRSRKNKNR